MYSCRLRKSRSGSGFLPLGERYRHDLNAGGNQGRRLGFPGRCRASSAGWPGSRLMMQAAGSKVPRVLLPTIMIMIMIRILHQILIKYLLGSGFRTKQRYLNPDPRGHFDGAACQWRTGCRRYYLLSHALALSLVLNELPRNMASSQFHPTE